MGIERYMRILELFDEEKPAWTISDIAQELDTSASTLYRLVREMVSVGFLENTVESQYRLGPLFIEYSRRLRLSDPLVRSGTEFLDVLVEQIELPCTAILARLYGRTVMCVAEAKTIGMDFKTSYELGRPMPFLRGATSKAVLSTLSRRHAGRLLERELNAAENSREALLSEFSDIRKFGISVTQGEVDKGLTGIAAPVHNSVFGINASLSVIVQTNALRDEMRPGIYSAVVSTARMIEKFIADRVASTKRAEN